MEQILNVSQSGTFLKTETRRNGKVESGCSGEEGGGMLHLGIKNFQTKEVRA